MEKEFIYTKSEFLSGTRKILIESNQLSKIDFAIFPILFIGSFFVKTLWISLIAGFIGFIGLIALFVGYIIMPRKLFKNTEYYHSEYFVDIKPENFYLQNSNTVIEKNWEDFQKIIMDNKFLYLYLEESALFIPLRVFSLNELETIKKIIKR